MLQQDFHRGNNPAYDRVAFVAEHYEELVFMYKDILEHLKQGGTGGGGGTGTGGCGCTRISKQVESLYGFVQLDKESFKLAGYDLNNPNDIQFLLHNISTEKYDYYNPRPIDRLCIEYHDTYEIDVGSKPIGFLARNIDDLFGISLPEEGSIQVWFQYTDQDYDIFTVNRTSFADKESFLGNLYSSIQNKETTLYDCNRIQNTPFTFKVYHCKDYDGSNELSLLYTKTSDSVENNPIYVNKTPKELKTFNNVLLYSTRLYRHSSGHLMTQTTLKIRSITPFHYYYTTTVMGGGEILYFKKNKYGQTNLNSRYPDPTIYNHYDLHTFTLTINPDIMDDYQ